MPAQAHADGDSGAESTVRSRADVERFTDAQAFLDETGPFLAEREAENNLLFGIAATLIVNPDRWPGGPYLAAVKRDDDVVAAAMMTPPWNVVISTTDDPAAVPVLGHDLGRSRFPVPGVTGPVEVARRFAELWTSRHGLTVRESMAERIYRADRIARPTGVAGSFRIGTIEDRALLSEWMGAFLDEAFHGETKAEAEPLVRSDLETGSRTYFIWEVDGRPVSMAGVTGPTPNGIRIGPVYTPPDDRRQGYGSAVTAAASQAQLDAGRRFVFLFTDLKNPTSNKIYQQLGYEPVIDVDQLAFEPDDPSGPR